MRTVQPSALGADSACAIVAHSSAAAPEFLVGANRHSSLLAARWRRRKVRLAEPARLSHHVLSYCAAGSGVCTIVADGVRIDHMQQAGALTYLPAGMPVQWTLDASSEIVHIHLYLTEDALDRYVGAHGMPESAASRSAFVAVHDPWFDGYFQLLLSEYELYGRCGRLDDSLFLDQTEDLLIGRLLLETPSTSTASSPSARRRVSPLRPTLLGRINEYLLRNVGEDVRLRQLAAIAGVSVDHFVRAFRQATGKTPHQYVLELRLNRARDLLSGGSAPIARIAQDCGFSSPAHFSVAFHHHFGLPPSQFRRRH